MPPRVQLFETSRASTGVFKQCRHNGKRTWRNALLDTKRRAVVHRGSVCRVRASNVADRAGHLWQSCLGRYQSGAGSSHCRAGSSPRSARAAPRACCVLRLTAPVADAHAALCWLAYCVAESGQYLHSGQLILTGSPLSLLLVIAAEKMLVEGPAAGCVLRVDCALID